MKDKALILAVDDTSESLALLDNILTSAGYLVRPADSGELALAAIDANPPDLILLNIRMKGMDGLEVCRRLKAREETQRIPIILISAFADEKEWVEGLQMGAADYITKPFQTEEILTRVKTHLTLKQATLSFEQQAAVLSHTNEQLQSEITGHKRSENDLSIAKRRWENTFDAITDIVCVISIEHEFIAINDAGVRALKLPRNEIVGKKCFELVHGTKEPLAVCPCKKSLQFGSEEFSEYEQNGRHYSLRAWPICDDSGKFTSFAHIVKDITERKRTENELVKTCETQAAINALLSLSMLDGSLTEFLHRALDLILSLKWLAIESKSAIFLADEARKMLHLQAHKGLSQELLAKCTTIPFGYCLCGRSAELRTVQFADRIDERHDTRYAGMQPHGHYCAPILSGDCVLGVLNLYMKEGHTHDSSEAEFIKAVADTLAGVIERKRAEEQIRKDLRVMEAMLKEIHHRVRNNLNLIISLLTLQADRITTKRQALEAFEETKNRIYAMALVHSNLYDEEDYSRINLTSFIQNLTQNLMQVYKTVVKIEVRIEDISLGINDAVPCGLILNELVTNALKHAFKDNREGRITIVFRALKEDAYELTVQDNGVGLPKEIDVRKSKSLGLLIVNQLIYQINGALKITINKGTKFQITFPASDA